MVFGHEFILKIEVIWIKRTIFAKLFGVTAPLSNIFVNMMFNVLLRIPWRRFWWLSRWPWKFTWFGTRLCNTWKDASIRGNWSIISYCLIDNPDLVCYRMTKALIHCLQVLQVKLVKLHFWSKMHFMYFFCQFTNFSPLIICGSCIIFESSAFFPSFSGNRSGIDMSKCFQIFGKKLRNNHLNTW